MPPTPGDPVNVEHESAAVCHLCRGPALLPLIDFGEHPVSKHYLHDAATVEPRWPVRLFFCESCGLTQLVDSCPPEVLYANYVTLSSWKPQPQVEAQIEMISRLDGITHESRIVEIGSNDGGFLERLGQAGFRQTVGIEPARDAYDASVAKGLEVVQNFVSPELGRALTDRHGEFDLLISRQNFEHIADLVGVIESIGVLLKPNGYVLIELPNFACNLRMGDYSLWEEHVNYFTIDTLRHFLACCNIEIIHQEIIVFSGEGLVVFGRRSDSVTPSLDYLPALRRENVAYAERWPAFRDELVEYLAGEKASGKKIAVYGAGSRAFCLMNWTGISPYTDVILDDQPEKQNLLMPGGRLPIVPGDELYTRDIDLCLLAVNAENEDKVIAKHQRWVRDGGEFWSVFPPSHRLLPLWSTYGA